MSQLVNRLFLAFHWVVFMINCYFLRWVFILEGQRTFFDDLFQMTNLNETLVCIFYLMVVIFDLKILLSRSNPASQYRYPEVIYILYQIVFALSGLVTIAYWGMRLYDFRLLLGKGEEPAPLMLSSFTHGLNFIILSAEGLIVPQNNTRSAKWKFVLYLSVVMTYSLIQFSFWKFTGKYVYPFLAAFTIEMTINFYVSLLLLAFILDRSGYWIAQLRWAVKHPVEVLSGCRLPHAKKIN